MATFIEWKETDLPNKFSNTIQDDIQTKPVFFKKVEEDLKPLNIRKEEVGNREQFRKIIFDCKFPVKAKNKTVSKRTKE